VSIALDLSGHSKDLGGGFLVSRLLPSPQCRSIGPFVFLDHFGPVTVPPQADFDVRPHPHIGLATVSYLFAGAMVHRDSLGAVQRIEPGDINWMTAGRGIVHSERRPADLAGSPYLSHGLQLWTALPRDQEEAEPSFVHTPKSRLPAIEVDGAIVELLIGRAFGAESPVATLAPTLFLAAKLSAGGVLRLPALAQEVAVLAVDGDIEIDGAPVLTGHLAVLEAGRSCELGSGENARIAVIGGAALDGHRYMWWNFVSSRRERILTAAADWEAGRFAKVPGEVGSIPLPERRPDFA
jgi:redox-sensitive bicupin YhaK (pirin superfamily)